MLVQQPTFRQGQSPGVTLICCGQCGAHLAHWDAESDLTFLAEGTAPGDRWQYAPDQDRIFRASARQRDIWGRGRDRHRSLLKKPGHLSPDVLAALYPAEPNPKPVAVRVAGDWRFFKSHVLVGCYRRGCGAVNRVLCNDNVSVRSGLLQKGRP